MSPYYSTLDYTEHRVVDARQVFKRFDEFFSSVNHVIRRGEQQEQASHRWHAEEHQLHAVLHESQQTVRSALSDLDTHRALTALLHLTARTAHYLHATHARGPVLLLLVLVRDYVSRMLTMFGLQGYEHVTVQSVGEARDHAQFTQLLDLFVHARQELRAELLQALKANSESRDQSSDQSRDLVRRLLPLVDKMRDELLSLGIKLEDGKGSTLIKELRADPRTEASLEQMRAKSKQRTAELKESSK